MIKSISRTEESSNGERSNSQSETVSWEEKPKKKSKSSRK